MTRWPYGTVARLTGSILALQSDAILVAECAKARVMVISDEGRASFWGISLVKGDYHGRGERHGDWTRSAWEPVDD